MSDGRTKRPLDSHASFQMPEHSNSGNENLFLRLPSDLIVANILPYCIEKLDDVPRLSLVNRRFNEMTKVCDEAHKRLFLASWPLQSDRIQFRAGGWLRMYKRRFEMFGKKSFDQKSREISPIEGCSVVFECPMRWEKLSKVEQSRVGSTQVRSCQECGKNVYKVDNVEVARKLVKEGNCIAYEREQLHFLGVMA